MLQSPLLWLVPVGGSRLFAQEKPQRVAAFRLCSLVLKALSGLLLAFYIHSHGLGVSAFQVDYIDSGIDHGSHVCETLPSWLRQPWWDPDTDICHVVPKTYTECFEKCPWYKNGGCNFYAAQCQLNAALETQHGEQIDYFDMQNVLSYAFLGSFIALVLQALAAAVWYCASCCFKTQPKPELINVSAGSCFKTQPKSEPINVCDTSCCLPKPEPMNVAPVSVAAHSAQVSSASFTDQAKFLIFKIGPAVLDVFSDVNGIVQFVLTGSVKFAAASALIFAASLYQQVQRGASKNFYKACVESVSQGAATDELEMILLSEKTVEAPMQFLIQVYAVMFVTSSEFAVISFLFFFGIKCVFNG